MKKNAIFFKLFWYKVFVHWKLKLLNFLMNSVLKPFPVFCCEGWKWWTWIESWKNWGNVLMLRLQNHQRILIITHVVVWFVVPGRICLVSSSYLYRSILWSTKWTAMFLRGMTPLIPVFFIHVTSKFVPCEKQNKTKRPDLLSKTLNLFKNNHVNCVFFVSSIGRLYCRYCYANEVAIVLEIIGGGQKSSEGMTSWSIKEEHLTSYDTKEQSNLYV